jgi:hypothetical protein
MNFKELDNIAKIAMAEELDEERTETELFEIEIKSMMESAAESIVDGNVESIACLIFKHNSIMSNYVDCLSNMDSNILQIIKKLRNQPTLGAYTFLLLLRVSISQLVSFNQLRGKKRKQICFLHYYYGIRIVLIMLEI